MTEPIKPDSELTERDLCDLGCGVVHSLTCDAPNNRTGQRCIRAFHHSGECEYAERPDSELQEALDELESAHDAFNAAEEDDDVNGPDWRAARDRFDVARHAIESLFERRIAEIRRERDFQELRATTHLRTVNHLGAELAALRSELSTLRELQLSPEEAAVVLAALETAAYDGLTASSIGAKLRLLSEEKP